MHIILSFTYMKLIHGKTFEQKKPIQTCLKPIYKKNIYITFNVAI